jgi:uncharacterized protein
MGRNVEDDKFAFDSDKAKSNLADHKLTFDEAKSVFLDPLAISGHDPDHSYDESRYMMFGESSSGHLLAVVFTYRFDKIRIISARKATKRERKVYENG